MSKDDGVINVPSISRRIPVAEIRENKTALREVNRKGEGYQELLKSVRDRGVLESVLVRECTDIETGAKFYGLINGLHRVTAARDAGLEDVPANVVSASDKQVLIDQMITNIQRVETKPTEYSKHLSRLMAQDPSMTLGDLADMIHKSPTYVSERMGLLKLTEKVAKLVDDGEINISNAFCIAKLPPEEQPDFVARATTMTPTEFTPTVAARVKQIRDEQRKGRTVSPETFSAVAHIRKLSVLKSEDTMPTVALELVRGLNTPAEGFAMGVKWCLHLDPKSVSEALAKDEARKREEADAKKRKSEERAKKQAQDAATKAAEAQA